MALSVGSTQAQSTSCRNPEVPLLEDDHQHRQIQLNRTVHFAVTVASIITMHRKSLGALGWAAALISLPNIVSATVPGYSALGCYTDSVGARTLNGPWTSSDTAMTYDDCATFCNGYDFFGSDELSISPYMVFSEGKTDRPKAGIRRAVLLRSAGRIDRCGCSVDRLQHAVHR